MESVDFMCTMVFSIMYILKGYTIIILEDEELHKKMLHLYHDLPIEGHLDVFQIAKALSSRYYWRGM